MPLPLVAAAAAAPPTAALAARVGPRVFSGIRRAAKNVWSRSGGNTRKSYTNIRGPSRKEMQGF